MRGYRCDNCLNFHPEHTEERTHWGGFVQTATSPPQEWITLTARGEMPCTLHFCGPDCLTAFSSRAAHLMWADRSQS